MVYIKLTEAINEISKVNDKDPKSVRNKINYLRRKGVIHVENDFGELKMPMDEYMMLKKHKTISI